MEKGHEFVAGRSPSQDPENAVFTAVSRHADELMGAADALEQMGEIEVTTPLSTVSVTVDVRRTAPQAVPLTPFPASDC